MSVMSRPGPFYSRIIQKLTDALRPASLSLKDVSHLHAGHKESSGLPETHFNLELVSDQFEGMSMLKRHRKVYGILADELQERVHALSMKTNAPSEVSS